MTLQARLSFSRTTISGLECSNIWSVRIFMCQRRQCNTCAILSCLQSFLLLLGEIFKLWDQEQSSPFVLHVVCRRNVFSIYLAFNSSCSYFPFPFSQFGCSMDMPRLLYNICFTFLKWHNICPVMFKFGLSFDREVPFSNNSFIL